MGRKKKQRVVECEVNVVDLDGANGPIEGVEVICPRCNERRTSFGTSDASVDRCFAMLHNGCPFGEDNLYIESDPDGD